MLRLTLHKYVLVIGTNGGTEIRTAATLKELITDVITDLISNDGQEIAVDPGGTPDE